MDQIIRLLYLNARKEENCCNTVSKEFQHEIVEMLTEELELDKEVEFEKIRDVAFMIGSAGEENGFVKGFKYAFRLFTECMK